MAAKFSKVMYTLCLLFIVTYSVKLGKGEGHLCSEISGVCGPLCPTKSEAKYAGAEASCDRLNGAESGGIGIIKEESKALKLKNKLCTTGIGMCNAACNKACCNQRCIARFPYAKTQGWCRYGVTINACLCNHACRA